MQRHRIPSRAIGAFGSAGIEMSMLVAQTGPRPEWVNIARIAPDGILGRHEAHEWQVLAVLSGRVVCSGGDGVESELGPGEAVRFEPGELHETRAREESLLALLEFGDARPDEA